MDGRRIVPLAKFRQNAVIDVDLIVTKIKKKEVTLNITFFLITCLTMFGK